MYFHLGVSFWPTEVAHVDDSGLAYQTRATAAVMILLVWDDVGMAFLTLALSSGDRVVGPPMMTDGCGRGCSGGLKSGAESDEKKPEPSLEMTDTLVSHCPNRWAPLHAVRWTLYAG